jgi:hypothetical protein
MGAYVKLLENKHSEKNIEPPLQASKCAPEKKN